ncbi:MAG: hypothetical protein HY390_06740 [Deltaproteobacteria bacterium]|nr:hypothetical protein [Deltaproteobacteria bacterium]
MKAISKIIYRGFVILCLSWFIGCGEATKDTQNNPTAQNPNLQTLGGAFSYTSPFTTPLVAGMYEGRGEEYQRQLVATTTRVYPGRAFWHTRIEFLTKEGRNVDPATFNQNAPIGPAKIKITLIHDVTGQKYEAVGDVWVRYGSLALIGEIRRYSDAGQPLFDIRFGKGSQDGPMLGIFNLAGRLHGAGAITLVDAAGEHELRYYAY